MLAKYNPEKVRRVFSWRTILWFGLKVELFVSWLFILLHSRLVFCLILTVFVLFNVSFFPL